MDITPATPAAPSREMIEAMESFLLLQPQINLGTQHLVASKLSVRTIFIPADTILTGAAHEFEHVNVCFGDIAVTTDEGPRRLTGFHQFKSAPGAKRIGYAYADTWWTTIHSIPEGMTDLTEIENYLVPAEAGKLQTRATLCAPGDLEVIA